METIKRKHPHAGRDRVGMMALGLLVTMASCGPDAAVRPAGAASESSQRDHSLMEQKVVELWMDGTVKLRGVTWMTNAGYDTKTAGMEEKLELRIHRPEASVSVNCVNLFATRSTRFTTITFRPDQDPLPLPQLSRWLSGHLEQWRMKPTGRAVKDLEYWSTISPSPTERSARYRTRFALQDGTQLGITLQALPGFGWYALFELAGPTGGVETGSGREAGSGG